MTEPSPSLARIGRFAGPAVFLAVLALPGASPGPAARTVAGVALWMAVWWVSEAIPLAATSLLPLVAFPLLGVESVRDVGPNYGEHLIFLFLGGFVVALAIERSGAHRRLALATVRALGGTPRRLVWGFLVAAALPSMWLSNTATALMMLPIASAVADRIDDATVAMRLFLAVAFGAGIGGLGTLVGTPPNLVLAGMAPSLAPGLPAIGFGGWMLFGVPLVAALLPAAGLLLARGLPPGPDVRETIERAARDLGPVTAAERRSLALLGATALAWITRADLRFGALTVPGWSGLLPHPEMLSDAVPAIAAALVACSLPAGGGERRPLVTWEEAHRGIPWGVLLLFGGGFALADGVHRSGLDAWLAERLHALAGLPVVLVVLAVVAVTIAITNLTSNTATATLMLPVMASLAEAIGAPPYLLMVAAAVAASCAFVFPVATPPNAIVMASERVSAADLFTEGLRLNLVAALIVVALVLTLGRLVLPLG